MMVGAVPFLGTGYGTVMRNVGKILAQEHTVMMSCDGWWGSLAKFENYYILPTQVNTMGGTKVPHNVQLAYHIRKYQPEAVLSIGDIFVWKGVKETIKVGLKVVPGKPIRCPWVAYFPVDGSPLPNGFRDDIKKVDHPITMSKFGQETVKKAGLSCGMIYHGVDSALYKPLPKEKMRAFFDIKSDALLVGYVGSNSERKKIPSLIEAVSHVMEDMKNPKVRFWLSCPRYDAYGWHLPEYLKQFDIRERTNFSPFIDEMSLSAEEMVALYNCFDVHASATSKEGFGLTHIESMACGIPNVATNCSSLPEVIGDSGFLAKVAGYEWDKWGTRKALVDVADLKNKIEVLLRDADLRKDLGAKARKRAEDFDWSKFAPQWLKLFKEIGSE